MTISQQNQAGSLQNFQENFLTVRQGDTRKQSWPNYPQLMSGTIYILQVLPHSMCTFNYARELKISIKSKMTYNVDLLCKNWHYKWYNPPKLQSGTINILQVWLCYWCTYNHARELKLRNDKVRWFMMSNLISEMIQSSKTPVRIHQCSPSMTVLLMQFNSY